MTKAHASFTHSNKTHQHIDAKTPPELLNDLFPCPQPSGAESRPDRIASHIGAEFPLVAVEASDQKDEFAAWAELRKACSAWGCVQKVGTDLAYSRIYIETM